MARLSASVNEDTKNALYEAAEQQGVAVSHIVQAALVSGEVEVDITGTVDLSDGTLHLSVLFTRRSEDGTARVGGTLGGTLDAPTLRVTRR